MTHSVYNHKTGSRHRHRFTLDSFKYSMLKSRGYNLVCNCDKCIGGIATELKIGDDVVSKRTHHRTNHSRDYYLVKHLKSLNQMVI